jgi:hypothetical protein
MKLNVLLLEGIHAVAEAALVEAGHNVRRIAGALKEDELIKQLDGVHMLGIRSKTNVTKKVRRGEEPAVDRRVLHRHESGRARRCDEARHRRVQRAVQQYAQRG